VWYCWTNVQQANIGGCSSREAAPAVTRSNRRTRKDGYIGGSGPDRESVTYAGRAFADTSGDA